jgi:hypothetical protein
LRAKIECFITRKAASSGAARPLAASGRIEA